MTAREGFTVWFTGMTNSGKSTLARLLRDELNERGLHAEALDGAEVRKTISDGLGFSAEDRERNVLRMGEVCRLLNRNGVVAVAAAVSPSRAAREKNRKNIGRYFEVWCRCPMETLERRDTTRFYERARAGEIKHVAGVDDPYEEPDRPEVIADTSRETPDGCVRRVLATLEILGYIEPRAGAAYTPEEEAGIKEHLKNMGYL